MSKTTRDRSLIFAALVMLITLLASGVFLGKTASRQFNEQYDERLRSGLTTYGVVLNFTYDGFVKAIQGLASDARLLEAVDKSPLPELKALLLEGAVQVGSDSLHLITPDGKPLTSYTRPGFSHPNVSSCFIAAGGVIAHQNSLYLTKAAKLVSGKSTIGYICGTLDVTPKGQAQQLENLLHGAPFLTFKGSNYFFDHSLSDAFITESAPIGESAEWQVGEKTYHGMNGELAIGRDIIGIGLLVSNDLYRTEIRRASLAVIFCLGAMLLMGLFAIRTMVRQHRTQRKLNHAKEQALVTLSSIGDSVITTDSSGKITFMNDAALKLTGLDPLESIGQHWQTMIQLHEGRLDTAADVVSASLKARKALFSTDDTELHCNNRIVPVTYTAAPIARYGFHSGSVIVLHDVSQERELRQELAWRASHDELTRLPNRRSFHQALTVALTRISHTDETAALMFMDLDKFKIINDTCGHEAGDQLLVQVCQLFSDNLRSEDILARMGGDEFAILLHNSGESDACIVANKLIEALGKFEFHYEDRIFQVGVSIGLQLLDKKSGDLDEVIRQADLACYAAKQGGRNRCRLSSRQPAEDTPAETG